MNNISVYKVNDHFLEVETVFVDQLINIPVIDKNKKVLGRAILTTQYEHLGNNGSTKLKVVTVLTDIIVYDPNDRGKGVGNELMGFITASDMFDTVVTGISTEPGRSLCLKHGFKQETVGKEKFLVWRSNGDDNGKTVGDTP